MSFLYHGANDTKENMNWSRKILSLQEIFPRNQNAESKIVKWELFILYSYRGHPKWTNIWGDIKNFKVWRWGNHFSSQNTTDLEGLSISLKFPQLTKVWRTKWIYQITSQKKNKNQRQHYLISSIPSNLFGHNSNNKAMKSGQ